MVFNKKAFTISIFSILGLIVLGTVTFGITYFFLDSNKTIINSITLNDKETFIRERTFSMKFNTTVFRDPVSGNNVKSSLFGTSWIFNKVVDQEIYYLATNVHVISNAVSLTSSQNNKYNIANYIESIEMGYPKEPNKVSSENDLSLEMISNASHFPKIVYSSTFIETSPIYSIPTSISPNVSFYNYAMSDFAILEFDFSLVSTEFKTFLNYYKANPTNFFSQTLGQSNYASQNYYIGGYPFLKDVNDQIGTWGFDHSLKETLRLVSGTIISNVPQSINNPQGVLMPNNITNPNLNDSNRYFQNISNQILINDISLTGGSSGSMVINDNYEVVGIYWGSYSSSNPTTSFGAFDILNTNTYRTIFPKNILGPEYKAYNRVLEAKDAISLPLEF